MSGLTYNLQVDSKFRDVEKYPNPCDFGVTFINTNTGTSVLGQPLSSEDFYSPVQIDPDYLESNIKIQNAEIFTFNKNDKYIFISGVMFLQTTGSSFKIDYQPQPSLELPNTAINYTGYNIVTLSNINILENPFVAVIDIEDPELYKLKWINYIKQYTGSYSDVVNNSTRSTIRISPSQSDLLFWCFDFSTSITITQYINNTYQTIKNIPEPSNGNTAILIIGFNIDEGTTYKYEAREWGYQLITSNYTIEKTKDNGRFNINLDDSNNIYVSGNISTFNPSYDYLKLPNTGALGTSNYNFTNNVIYYTTGSSGAVTYTHIIPINGENTIGVGVTGPSEIFFIDYTSTGSLQYKSSYIIQKDPGATYQTLGYTRNNMFRMGTGVYLISSMNDSTRTFVSYQSRIYNLDPVKGTGTLVSYFGSGASSTYYPSGLWSTPLGTDIYSIQRCGGTGISGSNRPDKLLVHKFNTLTNIGTTVCFTGPIQYIPTGQNSYPTIAGGYVPGIQESLCGQVVGTDIYIYMGNLNTVLGIGLVMPIIVLKWDTLTNTLTNYGVKANCPAWNRMLGIINYSSGRKILVVVTVVLGDATYFYDVTDPINIFVVSSINLNLYTFRAINYINSRYYAYGLAEGEMKIYDITSPENIFVVGESFQIAGGEFENSLENTYLNEAIGIGGSTVEGWYYYKTQPLISQNVTMNIKSITQNLGQYVRTGEEFVNQVCYVPKLYNNTNIQNFSSKMYLFSIYNKSMIVDDVSNINYPVQRKYISLLPFGFTQIVNRLTGLLATKANTFIFDDESGIYILFGFYNKLGLYYYNDNLNTLTQLYSEPVSSSLNGIVYTYSYVVNNERFAIYVFVNNIVKIYRIDNLNHLTLVSTTSPSIGSFNISGGAILVYYTVLNKYYLHIYGNAALTTFSTPRRINSIELTNPYSPIPTPASYAYEFDTNTTTPANGMFYFEDENLDVYLYVAQQVSVQVFKNTNPLNYDLKNKAFRYFSNSGQYTHIGQGFFNPINKKRYIITPFYSARSYPPNPVYLFDATEADSPKLLSSTIEFADNVNQNPMGNITICQNGNKTYASILLLNVFFSTGAWAPNPVPGAGSTGATGADIYNNYLYFLYDLSNPEFASYNQFSSSISNSFTTLPFNGCSFISKINADGTLGWFNYLGAYPNSNGLFTNISNFVLDKSKKYIYISGGWQNSIAFYQTTSPSGVYNYFNSQNTVYNSFVAKLNIFTGEWIWALPLIGNLDDFTQRLSYQNYNNSELLLMSMHFNSLSLNTYQAINSYLNPTSTLNNIISIVNNTSSVSSVLYAFTTSGLISWAILLFSKTPLTNVYIKDVDSTDGIITVIGIADTQELYCQDSTGLEVQTTYSNIDPLTQQYIFIYRFTYQGIYIASQRIDFPNSNIYLNINDTKTFTSDNKFIVPITFKNINQDKINIFNKDGTFAQYMTQYSPLETNTILVSFKNNSQFYDINNKLYTKLKILYPINQTQLNLTNYFNYLFGYFNDSTLNKSFNIRYNEYDNQYLFTILNQYIDTSKIKRIFTNYSNTGQFTRPDLNFYRTSISKTSQNGYIIADSIDSVNHIIYISEQNFTPSNNLFITISSGPNTINVPVQYIQNYTGSQNVLLYSGTIQSNNFPYLIINSKNQSAYYTYQFYPGSLEKSNYFVIKKLTMTIPNRLIRNSTYNGLRDLNDLPYLYLKIFNEDKIKNVDINNFNLVYDNNVNTGTNACFQFPISYAGTTSNFTTLSLDIQPRIKFSYNYYNFRFQLLDPEGEVIIFDPTPYKLSDSIFTGQVPANLLNITVRMQISLSN